MIELVDIHKSFGRQHVLDGVNLPVEQAKTTDIIGRSGGGKSVVLKHMIGLLKPDSGKVLVEGTDIARMATGI
jgi:phospholipid/cholesterol/gamma-HCH transport system ATP-binding protein